MDDGIRIHWQNDADDFNPKTYSRNHQWLFSNGVTVPVSAAVKYLGDAACVNPEQGVIASLASCHMLTFLALAAKAGHHLLDYEDTPYGVLEKNADGRMALTRITLRPRTHFADPLPGCDLEALHQAAHRHCFVAASLRAEVRIKPVLTMAEAVKLGQGDCTDPV